MWDQSNPCTDAYGGKTIRERNRFAVDVIKAVRAAVGEDLTLILRISQWKSAGYNAKIANTPAEMEAWMDITMR